MARCYISFDDLNEEGQQKFYDAVNDAKCENADLEDDDIGEFYIQVDIDSDDGSVEFQ